MMYMGFRYHGLYFIGAALAATYYRSCDELDDLRLQDLEVVLRSLWSSLHFLASKSLIHRALRATMLLLFCRVKLFIDFPLTVFACYYFYSHSKYYHRLMTEDPHDNIRQTSGYTTALSEECVVQCHRVRQVGGLIYLAAEQ
jgi:hypothetical protein